MIFDYLGAFRSAFRLLPKARSPSPGRWRRRRKAGQSLSPLWVVQLSAHSPRACRIPRSKNCRWPRPCLIWPNTGSIIALLRHTSGGPMSDRFLAKGARLWHDSAMRKPKAKKQKLPAKNPSDPMKLARSVVEAAIGEPLSPSKNELQVNGNSS